MGLENIRSDRRRPAMAVICRTFGCLLAAALVASLLFPGVARATGLSGMAIVNASSLNMRQSASTSARVIRTLARGDVVRVVSDAGTWCSVVTSGGQTGWCQSAYLVSTSSSSVKPSATALLDWPSLYINFNAPFKYDVCMQDLDQIVAANPGLARKQTIGTSYMGRPINAIVIGNPNAQARILVQAAIHAREWLTALLALRQAETLLNAAKLGGGYKGMSVSRMLQNVEVWIVPEANPDGVRLCMEGLASAPLSMRASLQSMNGGSTNFTRWKANGRGVDLNRNFDGGWRMDPNYKKPGPYYYGGPHPFSEPEAIALRDLTYAKDFVLTMSYHSSGEILYWYNHTGVGNKMSRFIAGQINVQNGYTVLAPSAQAPSGGYRDWFVEEFGMPGFTLEMGSGYCPLPQSNFHEYWQDNRFLLLELMWAAMPKGNWQNVRLPRVYTQPRILHTIR